MYCSQVKLKKIWTEHTFPELGFEQQNGQGAVKAWPGNSLWSEGLVTTSEQLDTHPLISAVTLLLREQRFAFCAFLTQLAYGKFFHKSTFLRDHL